MSDSTSADNSGRDGGGGLLYRRVITLDNTYLGKVDAVIHTPGGVDVLVFRRRFMRRGISVRVPGATLRQSGDLLVYDPRAARVPQGGDASAA